MRATRSELLRLKERIKVAKSAKSVLEKKLEALVKEKNRIKAEIEERRDALIEKLREARKAIGMASAYDGFLAIKSSALASNVSLELEVEERNVFGAFVPRLHYRLSKGKFASLAISLRVAEAREKFLEVIEAALSLAEQEFVLRVLLNEISKTKRRVNALENIVIPELEMEKRRIEEKLEEIEREDFVRLKKLFG